TESDETNNVSSVTFDVTAPGTPPPPPSTLPDLIVPVANISVPASVQQGTALSISYIVRNQGGTGAGHHWAGINVDSAPTPSNAVAYNEVNSLAAGAQLSETNSISTAGLSIGPHTLSIMPYSTLFRTTESDETNNVSSVTFDVTAPGTPPPPPPSTL